MAPPSWTVSQGSAQEEEEVEEQRGLTPRIRGPRNASTSPTSPSASETLTYGKCLGCVEPQSLLCPFEKKKDAFGREEKKKLTSALWRVTLNVSKMWCSERKAEELCFLILLSSAATMWPNINLHLSCLFSLSPPFFSCFQQFGKILDVEIIFNERGSKVERQKPDICPNVSI